MNIKIEEHTQETAVINNIKTEEKCDNISDVTDEDDDANVFQINANPDKKYHKRHKHKKNDKKRKRDKKNKLEEKEASPDY